MGISKNTRSVSRSGWWLQTWFTVLILINEPALHLGCNEAVLNQGTLPVTELKGPYSGNVYAHKFLLNAVAAFEHKQWPNALSYSCILFFCIFAEPASPNVGFILGSICATIAALLLIMAVLMFGRTKLQVWMRRTNEHRTHAFLDDRQGWKLIISVNAKSRTCYLTSNILRYLFRESQTLQSLSTWVVKHVGY